MTTRMATPNYHPAHGEATPGADRANGVARPPGMAESLGSLSRAINELEDAVAGLDSRLEPLLVPVPINAGAPPDQPGVATRCPIAETILDAARRAERLRDRVASIHRCLDL